MNIYLLCGLTLVAAYLAGGLNGAILFSKLFYHKDIRNYGSGNPGFTNFKRVFGSKLAWFVFLFDIAKTLLPVWLAWFLFPRLLDPAQFSFNLHQFGAAFAGLSVMLGHAFPVWYKFKGGKTFTACSSSIFFVDWRMALMVWGLFLLLLFTVKIMSLSSCSLALAYPIVLLIFDLTSFSLYGTSLPGDWPILLFAVLSAILLIGRHHENLNRVFHGQEKKFYLFGKKHEPKPEDQVPNENTNG
ncbi:MAG: glycerol-3-phosphate 1-O-acyltransferase PlsY [Clostridia bacterium]|nr:glycerol-3-phosphate 1-O-acyltransferase PlsY [Clostridia bacterium]